MITESNLGLLGLAEAHGLEYDTNTSTLFTPYWDVTEKCVGIEYETIRDYSHMRELLGY